MNLQHTRATRASLHLKMAKALNVQSDDITSPEAAFIEAVCWSESPGTTLLLAEVIEDQCDHHTAHMGVQHVIVDPSELWTRYDQHTVDTALKLAGLVAAKFNGKTVFSTTKNPKNTLPIVRVSGDVLKYWMEPI